MAEFSVRKPFTVLVGVIMVIVLGIVSFSKMTADLLPNISLPYMVVMTTYVGASPETVEMAVTKPVEASMATVSNIESINSVSGENYSMVILEFSQGADMDSVSFEVRENLDQIAANWEESISNPIIMKLNPDMLPVMIAAVGMEGYTDTEISDYAQNTVIPELESIEGVASVSATGLVEESVNVIIRQDKIDAINEQIFGYIDGEMAEQEEQLAEGRKEIEDGRAELADAQKELNDSRKEIEDGRAELAENKSELEEGKNQLAQQKDEAAKNLAEAETQLLTAKADLEASKMDITTQMTTLRTAQDGLNQASNGRGQLEEAIRGIDAAIAALPQLREGIAALDAGIAQGQQQIAGLDGIIAGLQAASSLTFGELPEEIKAAVSGLLQTQLAAETPVSSLLPSVEAAKVQAEAALTTAQTQRSELQTQLDTILAQGDENTLPAKRAELQAQRDAVHEQVLKLEDAINASTMGMGTDAYLSTLEQTLSTINENIAKVDEGLKELYQGNLEAATEIANAQAKLDLGEAQMSMAESQLESGEKQLESGQEQIDEGLKQLDEALEQLEDGEKQLKEAREEAYANADMTDILTVDTVKALLTAQNFSMPGGYVTEEGIDYLVRVGDKPTDLEALAAMPIMNPDMEGVDIITLSDVADVFMTDNAEESYTNVNGAPGIMLTIQKQTGYSTGEVSDKLKVKFEEMMGAEAGLSMLILMDQGIYIDIVMDSIFSNLIFGGLLAVLILIIFLKDWRPTLVIACSIPVSLVTAIVCMYFSGVTLNVISLSGLALGVGMLVDNSIVVIENIYRLRNEGRNIVEAAIEGAGEVANAIIASTLTTVCVFAPIVFTEGITRQLFVDMGLTIAYSLLASLVIALTVVPAMAAGMLTKTKEQKEGKIFKWIVDIYEKLLEFSLKWKPVVLIAVLVLLVVSIAAAFSKGTAFMPEMESTQITVNIQMPKGTPLSETGKTTDLVAERVLSIEDVVDVGAMTEASDMSMLMGGGGGSSSDNASVIYVTLKEDKKLTGNELAAEILRLTEDIEKAEITVETSSMDLSALGGSGISIQIRGRELDTLQKLAKDIAAIVEETEGTAEVSDGLEDSSEELRIIIDREKAIEYGLTVAQVYQQIAVRLAEASSSTALETEIREYDVYVKNAEDIALTRETIKKLEIDVTKQDGTKEKVVLSEIATFETWESPDSVNRVDQNRYMSVTASIAEGYNVGLVSQGLQERLDEYEMPDGYTLVMTGENETINEAMEQLVLMLILAILFMYLIMVAQFQSLMSPFIIMFTIPLAFTGGFLGLYLSGSEVSVIAIIGFVMLSGVIVNNGIVLVDYINQLREEGMEKRKAILKAGRTRLRPVLMTALTTILALSTMAFSKGMGADLSKPMAVVTIGGLIYGTLLTLVVVPCIYDIFTGGRKKKEEA
ncbi:MAG: efflux RND transporter permease subunit [Lachnospiraceae bacterium]|nr:efflux RND transporter permease subunit [Lachnospiraceae bacterium]